MMVSKQGEELISSFRGPMIRYKIVKSIDRNKGTICFWSVFSQGKRRTLVRYLWGKLLWDELNSLEREVFWHLSEITLDKTIYLGLKALAFGISKKLLRERLEKNPFGLSRISRQQYLSIKGSVNFFFKQEEVILQAVPKYSGYARHHNDKGSLRSFEREVSFSPIFDPLYDEMLKIIFEYLTVGVITLFHGGVVFHPEEAKKQKR